MFRELLKVPPNDYLLHSKRKFLKIASLGGLRAVYFDVEFSLVGDRSLGHSAGVWGGGCLGRQANWMCADLRQMRDRRPVNTSLRSHTFRLQYDTTNQHTDACRLRKSATDATTWAMTLPLRASRKSPNKKPVKPKQNARK